MTDIFLPQKAIITPRSDGALILESPYELHSEVSRTGDWLDHWATVKGDCVFIAERSGIGWHSLTYGESLDTVKVLAESLLGMGLGPSRPLMLLSGKSINHALLVLAAQYVGIPSVAVAEQYSLVTAAHDKLQHVLSVIQPGAVFAEDSEKFAAALNFTLLRDVPIIAVYGQGSYTIEGLKKGDKGAGLEVAKAEVTPDTLAKLLFTSGSTSMPKAVRTTHRMLTANQAQIAQVFPFLKRHPQRIVDWLPWNHTFGGSHNFNLMLSTGGTLYLDDGEPSEKGTKRTIENIRMVGQTVSFNVPIAYSMMAKAMRKDSEFRRQFFKDLELVFYAAAGMPQGIWDELKEHAMKEKGKAPEMSASWGMTETAPAALMVHGPMKTAGVIGVPLPGLSAKLLPITENAWELRVKGPNVTDGYYNAPDKTAESFDDEGYLITGDVVRFVDPDEPSDGLHYDGRIAEDFKLLSGTWVQVSKVRTAAVSALAPLVRDLVICGHNETEIGALAFVDPVLLCKLERNLEDSGGALIGDRLRTTLLDGLKKFNAGGGSSMRIVRLLILAEEPSLARGEITIKGNLNQKLLLQTRSLWVERLYDDRDPGVIR